MALRTALGLVVGTLLVIPLIIHAGISKKADEMCKPVYIDTCGCKSKMGTNGCEKSPNMHLCPCWDTPPGGKVTGICVDKINCEGKKFTDQEGKSQSPGDAKGMADALKGVMDLLKEFMKKEPKPPSQQPAGLPGQQGCTAFYQVSIPSTEPCANYVQPLSQSLGSSSLSSQFGSDLLGALGGTAGTGLQDALEGREGAATNVSSLLSPSTGTSDEGQTAEAESSTSTGQVGYTGLGGTKASLQSGAHGDIEIREGGATVVAGTRDEQTNTEVAGFYGSDTSGEPRGIVARMCLSRPWANSVVSFVIPPSFFDGLCMWRGYQVGKPPPPSAPVQQKATQTTPPPQPEQTITISPVPPAVDIWAVPEKVPLGARTSVFWNTRGVAECTISGPDGNFRETSLSGGAATVPLSGPTTFTISCLTPEGKPVTSYVTVNLSI